MKRIVKISVLALALVAVAGCSGGPGRGTKAVEKPPTAVVITHPAPRTIERTVRFTGSLKGNREVMVYPSMPGKFMGYALAEGSYVSKGATIARIDRDIPGVSYEPVPVQAPISGRFFSIGVSPGEMVAPQMAIARVSETTRLKLEFNIPEKYVNSVKQGSKASLYVPTVDYRATATLTRVSRFIQARSGAAQAEATVSNPGGKLTPGMHAEINVVVASQKATLAIPIDCVLGLDNRFVYVVTERTTGEIDKNGRKISAEVGKAEKRNIEVGLDDGAFIEVISGLRPEDEVIYVGQRIVEEGGKVRVTDTYKPTEAEE
jgi:membrane fusion protein (multidrug efflux system)